MKHTDIWPWPAQHGSGSKSEQTQDENLGLLNLAVSQIHFRINSTLMKSDLGLLSLAFNLNLIQNQRKHHEIWPGPAERTLGSRLCENDNAQNALTLCLGLLRLVVEQTLILNQWRDR